MTTDVLFTPLQLGPFRLAHRIVMPPLTRMRAAEPDNVPDALNAEYYAQRATPGGFIIAEATAVDPQGKPFPGVPGIYSQGQIAGWRGVTDAIHARGGIVFLQLWHGGRVGHSSLMPGGALPVAPSAVAPSGETWDASGKRVPFETPRALETGEIPGIVESYRRAARNALEAGFDGVEVHSANGYLLEQFLLSRTNLRADAYGGSFENRSRLVAEICTAIAGDIGADRVGVRLSPFGIAQGVVEDDPLPLFSYVVKRLAALGLAFVHFIEPRASGVGMREIDRPEQPQAAPLFRPYWPGVLISTGGHTQVSAAAMVASGAADAIGFGRHFISNPDLPLRIKLGAPFTHYDRPTFYTRGPKGYTDYPFLDAAGAA
jgi:N-ethylmaleimide reductase